MFLLYLETAILKKSCIPQLQGTFTSMRLCGWYLLFKASGFTLITHMPTPNGIVLTRRLLDQPHPVTGPLMTHPNFLPLLGRPLCVHMDWAFSPFSHLSTEFGGWHWDLSKYWNKWAIEDANNVLLWPLPPSFCSGFGKKTAVSRIEWQRSTLSPMASCPSRVVGRSPLNLWAMCAQDHIILNKD